MAYKTLVTILLALFTLAACQHKQTKQVTPWGDTINVDDPNASSKEDITGEGQLSLKDIQKGGEMIMLTLNGPETYYEYHGRGLGVQYLMCEKLAEHLGVTLRVDVCKDTLDMLQRLRDGEGDIIAVPVSKQRQKGFITVANNWLVNPKSKDLAQAVISWYKPEMLAETRRQEHYLLTTGMVTRHVYAMMRAPEKGQISIYDNLFRKYAPTAGFDWTLMAAQCYQESCFDPKAHSWAGACGLMQIMPGPADHLGLARSQMYNPEQNIAASARYLRELQALYQDVGNPQERMKFAIASYNGGYYHVRDAMALTRKYGGISQRWDDVRHYILALSQPHYYRDPVVKYGYMRGTETVDYVDRIVARWAQYREALRTGSKVVSAVHIKNNDDGIEPSPSLMNAAPHRASKKNKFRVSSEQVNE